VLAVDAIEAGVRADYDEALTVVRWVAANDANPRLRWWSATLDAGAALLSGDLDAAERCRARAFELGERHRLPGWVAAELVLSAEAASMRQQRDELLRFVVPPGSPVLDSPIASACIAWMAACVDEPARAAEDAWRVVRALDDESSLLLCLTFLAQVAGSIDDELLVAQVERRLAPWIDHVAVDASAWWCGGPVRLSLAELASRAGAAVDEQQLIELRARTQLFGDVRSVRRIDALLDTLDPATAVLDRSSRAVELDSLTERERRVLELLSEGCTNAEIGRRLSYSASTIRADTVSLYRKLGVNGRAQAAALVSSMIRPSEGDDRG
jgi:DNA-binding CsgD family transcriptional regulator